MAATLSFNTVHLYDLSKAGITVAVQLRHGAEFIDVSAKVDTGSSCCVFARRHGERLGLNIESGWRQEIGTPTGSFPAYGHQLTLSMLGYDFDSTVYFAADEWFRRDVLGRQGWLDHIRLGLVDYEGKLFVSDYNDPT